MLPSEQTCCMCSRSDTVPTGDLAGSQKLGFFFFFVHIDNQRPSLSRWPEVTNRHVTEDPSYLAPTQASDCTRERGREWRRGISPTLSFACFLLLISGFFSALPLLLTVLLLLHNCQRRRAMTNRSPCWLTDLLSAEPLNIGCSSKRPHLNPLLPIVSMYSDLNRKAPVLQLTPTK